MKRTLLIYSLAASLCLSYGCDNKPKQEDTTEVAEDINEEKFDNKKEDDAEFFVDAASGGMMEVELGKLAVSKGTAADVKALGQMMVTDHTKSNEELTALAAQKNITLPAAMGEKHQEKYDKLAKLSGTEFDKEYVDCMVDDHEDDVKKFKKASEDAKDADIKAFAAKTLPTLQQHLDHVKMLDEKMDKQK